MYGLGQIEIATRNAERTINSLIEMCQRNEGRAFIVLDNGECLQLTGKASLMYYTMTGIREEFNNE